jgi:hypothetical protein
MAARDIFVVPAFIHAEVDGNLVSLGEMLSATTAGIDLDYRLFDSLEMPNVPADARIMGGGIVIQWHLAEKSDAVMTALFGDRNANGTLVAGACTNTGAIVHAWHLVV